MIHGTLLGLKYVDRGGVIINTSSLSGKKAFGAQCGYLNILLLL